MIHQRRRCLPCRTGVATHCSRCGQDYPSLEELRCHQQGDCELTVVDERRWARWSSQRDRRRRAGPALASEERWAQRQRGHTASPQQRNRERIAQQSARAEKAGRPGPDSPFEGFDTEGGNLACHQDGCGCPAYQADWLRHRSSWSQDLFCRCGHELENHRHALLLVRMGDQVLETGTPLSWDEVFDFMCQQDPTRNYVVYFGNYDINMICATLPKYKRDRLLDRDLPISRGGRKPVRSINPIPLPLDVGPFEIDWIPGHEFKVRRACTTHTKTCRRPECASGCENPAHPKTCPNCPPWIFVSDVGPFFQAPFISALEQWTVGSADDRAKIAAGKTARASFAKMSEEIREYNKLEVDLLVRLMNKFRATCEVVGHLPSRWQGPGALAEALLLDHRIPKKSALPMWPRQGARNDAAEKLAALRRSEQVDIDALPRNRRGVPAEQALRAVPVLKAMAASYIGGWIEAASYGQVEGTVYNPDQCSAYPFALLHVPCLEHGRWVESTAPTEKLYLAFVHFKATEYAAFYGLGIRASTGGIYRPAEGRGWYWSFEIDAAVHQKVKYARCFNYSMSPAAPEMV